EELRPPRQHRPLAAGERRNRFIDRSGTKIHVLAPSQFVGILTKLPATDKPGSPHGRAKKWHPRRAPHARKSYSTPLFSAFFCIAARNCFRIDEYFRFFRAKNSI